MGRVARKETERLTAPRTVTVGSWVNDITSATRLTRPGSLLGAAIARLDLTGLTKNVTTYFGPAGNVNIGQQIAMSAPSSYRIQTGPRAAVVSLGGITWFKGQLAQETDWEFLVVLSDDGRTATVTVGDRLRTTDDAIVNKKQFLAVMDELEVILADGVAIDSVTVSSEAEVQQALRTTAISHSLQRVQFAVDASVRVDPAALHVLGLDDTPSLLSPALRAQLETHGQWPPIDRDGRVTATSDAGLAVLRTLINLAFLKAPKDSEDEAALQAMFNVIGSALSVSSSPSAPAHAMGADNHLLPVAVAGRHSAMGAILDRAFAAVNTQHVGEVTYRKLSRVQPHDEFWRVGLQNGQISYGFGSHRTRPGAHGAIGDEVRTSWSAGCVSTGGRGQSSTDGRLFALTAMNWQHFHLVQADQALVAHMGYAAELLSQLEPAELFIADRTRPFQGL